MLERIVSDASVFLFVAVRCFATIMTLPLFSSRTVPRAAKIALAGYMAFFIFPQISLADGIFSSYKSYISPEGNFSLEYLLLLAGEAMIGIILGFFVQIIFASFSTAGQFFAFQMGFSASEVYDALSQVENPLMGQFFNLIAMLIFLQGHWAQLLFGKGLAASFETMNAMNIVMAAGRQEIITFLLSSLTRLFACAFVIALPIMGILLLVSITTGILGKAAPQMNLLSEGFPVLILLSFFIIMSLMGSLCDYFISSFASGFSILESLFAFFRSSGGQ